MIWINDNGASQVQPEVRVTIRDHPEDGDEDRQRIVEQALIPAHLHEATGFKLKHERSICSPNLDLDLTVGGGLTALNWKMGNTSRNGWFCCFPCSGKWQEIKLFQRATKAEVMSFRYKPDIWLGSKRERTVDIYIPQSAKRIGFLKYRGQINRNGTAVDCVRKSAFTISNVDSDSSIKAITITNRIRIPVAVAQSTSGFMIDGDSTWTGFQLEFIPSLGANDLSVSERAVVLVAFMMWVISYREKIGRTSLGWLILLMIFVFVLSGLFYRVFFY